MGFDVEVDVWLIDDQFFLGHDCPQYKIDIPILLQEGVWCHSKNISALERMLELGAHCFWHEEDAVTLTSRGYVWTYPGKMLTPISVCVMPETSKYSEKELKECCGVCTDYPLKYRKLEEDEKSEDRI